MNEIIDAGFTKPTETSAANVDPESEIIAGTGEIDENEAAEGSTDGQTDTPEAKETADVSSEKVIPKFDPPKKAPLFDPKNPYEKAVAKYLEANASDQLLKKIREAKTAGYNIRTCFAYIRSQAQKMAKDGCAMVEDATVYGWAVHYFEDEWQADAKKKAAAKAKEAAAKAKAEAEKKAKEEAEAARLAAMTPEERELEQRAKEEDASAEAQAVEEARREKEESAAKAKAEKAAARRAIKKIEKDAYTAYKTGKEIPTDGLNDEQKKAVAAGTKKAKAEIAAAKKAEREAKAEAKRRAEEMQGDLFAGLFN